MTEYLVTDYGVMPNTASLQTKKLQEVLDLCKTAGGRVRIPRGEYIISSVRMWSDTEIYLESGAVLLGSENCDDYEVFPLSDGYVLYSDQQAFIHRHGGVVRDKYRRAIISAYAEKNISIIGENGSVIDGRNCYDPEGEEHFRGPHGIFLSNCENVMLKGYTIQNTGNFMHEAHNCNNLTMDSVTALAGHDGIHLHKTQNAVIKNCVFKTGDDCIAGCDVSNLLVHNCEINTSCNCFRMGGTDILIENCNIWGPGYYPHRLTVIGDDNKRFDRTAGRHNTLNLIEFFATPQFSVSQPSNITFKDCTVKNIDRIMHYQDGSEACLHLGQRLEEIRFNNVDFIGLRESSYVTGNEEHPVKIYLNGVNIAFADGEKQDPFICKNAVIKESD